MNRKWVKVIRLTLKQKIANCIFWPVVIALIIVYMRHRENVFYFQSSRLAFDVGFNKAIQLNQRLQQGSYTNADELNQMINYLNREHQEYRSNWLHNHKPNGLK